MTRNSCLTALLTLGALFPTLPAGAATYHVAQRAANASDTNPGSAAQPWQTIGRAATGKELQAGDTVVVHTGTYRESVTVTKSGTMNQPIRFEADPAASVILTGADLPGDWRKESGSDPVYSTPWSHVFIPWSKDYTHGGPAPIGRCEQVFVQDYPLLQVMRRESLCPGTFFVDLDGKRLYAWATDGADLSRLRVEASARNVVWESKGDYVQLRGFRVRYAANRAQEGAAQFSGQGDVVEDCVFERTNGVGATFLAPNIVVRRCTFQDNGQLGFSANHAHNLLLTECLVRNNNVKGFDRGWEAGGDKLVFCRKAVLEKSQFLANRGCGIWFDIGNEACEVRQCLIAENEDAGIFYEISFGLYAHDNVILENGLADTPGAWGASSGIALSSSPNCVIERNLLLGNKEGFAFREQGRRTPRISDDKHEEWIWNHDEVVRHNILAYNRDAQTWGWFDAADERHWPAAQQSRPVAGGSAGPDQAAAYKAKDNQGAPAGLSLEKLKLRLEGNLYAVRDGQELFHWGTAWRRNKAYSSIDAVRAALNLEQGSRMLPFVCSDMRQRDFRVPANSPALALGCYPKGPVPGVILGVLKH